MNINGPDFGCDQRLQVLIEETTEQVTLSVFTVHPETLLGATCWQRPFTVTLDEPLGGRALVSPTGESLLDDGES